MPVVNINTGATGGGISIQSSFLRSADGVCAREISLAAGKAGTLSTRTDNDTGIATVGSGHGITTSHTVDVFWSGGRRYGMTVTGTTSTTISVDGGSGDNLPAQDTVIVVAQQIQVVTAELGDNLSVLAIEQVHADPTVTAQSHVAFYDAGDTEIYEYDLQPNTPIVHDVAGGAVNPFEGEAVTYAMVSNGDSSGAATFKFLALHDSTP